MFVDIGLKFYAFKTHLSDLEVKVMGQASYAVLRQLLLAI